MYNIWFNNRNDFVVMVIHSYIEENCSSIEKPLLCYFYQ